MMVAITLVLTSVLLSSQIMITVAMAQRVDCNVLSKSINQDVSNTTDTPDKRVNDMTSYISNCK